MKQNLRLMAMFWPLLKLCAFFNRHLHLATRLFRDRFQTAAVRQGMCEQSLSGTGTPRAEAHMEVPRHAKVGHENTRVAPCPSPPSLTLPSGPIPMCPAYTSVKTPKSGTLANSKRLHSGRKAYMEGHGMEWDACPSTTRGWFKYAGAIVLPLPGCASAFFRSVVEGFSKLCRTSVEALSKDCRTTPEQQSNTRRRNFEESCVWTHAMAPARYGLGLALGLMATLFLTIMCLEARAQRPEFSGPVPPGVIVFFMLMVLSLSGTAQFYKPSNVSVQIGEALPESFYNTAHQAVNMQTGEVGTLQMAACRDKLIILDFWASWCGPCIHSLNKLDSLKRNEEQEDYVVIPVTYQSTSEASRAYGKYQWNFTGIVGDTTLGKIFPHSGLPHMVWIKDGKVVAMPYASYANRENITSAAADTLPQMLMRPKYGMWDAQDPSVLLSDTAAVSNSRISMITGRKREFSRSQPTVRQEKGNTVVFAMNLELEELLVAAFANHISPEMRQIKKHGITWEISDSLRAVLKGRPPMSNNGNLRMDSIRQSWLDSHTYCYYLRLPKVVGEKEALAIMAMDLSAYFKNTLGLQLDIESDEYTCLVMEDKRVKKASSGSGRGIYTSAVSNKLKSLSPGRIVLDECKRYLIPGGPDLASIDNLTAIKRMLHVNGITLKEKQKHYQTLVIRETK